MTDTQLAFDFIPEDATSVHILGSLVFDKRQELGPKAYLSLTDVTTHKPLARDCIAALYEHTSPSRIANDSSCAPYALVIKELIKYCAHKKMPSAFRMRDITLDFLSDFRTDLHIRSTEYKSAFRRKRYGNIVRLLEAGQRIGLASPDLVPPRNFLYVEDSDSTQPYTAGEALDFESACRTHIRELIARLEKGKELLAIGKNPKGGKGIRDPKTGRAMPMNPADRPWIQLPNLLWYVENVLDGKYLKRSELLKGHSSFNNVLMGCWGSQYRKGDVYSHLYPLMEDLIPFVILLAKKTGRNESSILTLKRDCLQEIGGRYLLHYEKDRGAARRYTKAINNDGPFSPVALIKTLQQVTEPLVRHARPEDQGYLLIGLSIDGHESPVKPPEPAYFKYQMNREGGWCDQWEITNEHGAPQRVSLRKWRVFYLTDRYKKSGQLGKVSRDAAHTLARTTVDYVANDATRHIHEQAIRAAQKEARALARPAVVFDELPENLAATLGTDITGAQRILRGEQDVLFAACKDFYNRPGGQPNTPCDKPWGCFICSNAIVTRHVLPRVVLLRDFIQTARKELSHEDWQSKFGEMANVINNDVLPRFSIEAIEEAERLSKNQVLYIPLAMRT